MLGPSRRTFLIASGLALSACSLPNLRVGDTIQEEIDPVDSYLANIPEGNFESDAGYRIELSREKGIAKLYTMAEQKEVEVAAIYVTKYDTWITTSKDSGENFAKLSLEHADYLLKNNVEIEFFHTHVRPEEENEANIFWWVIPGFHDLNRSIQYNDRFKGPVRESIVTDLGTITYWSKNLSWLDNLGDYRVAALRYESTVRSQATTLSSSLKGITRIGDLQEALEVRRDFLEVHFEER